MTYESIENGEKYFAEATRESISDISSAVEEYLGRQSIPIRAQMQLMIALDEILTNIVSYAYPETRGDMELSVTYDGKAVTMAFTDSGVAYDPLKAKEPDITLPAEDRAIGGLGILMVKKTMDNMNYERIDGKNILMLIKRVK